MAQGKNTAETTLELDTSVTESNAGTPAAEPETPGGQQNNGNQGNTGNGGGQPNSGNGDDKNKTPGTDKKIGLSAYIQKADPNKYVIAMLKSKNAMEVHTLDEWQQIVKSLLDKKVS
jgi:hypothetical protein